MIYSKRGKNHIKGHIVKWKKKHVATNKPELFINYITLSINKKAIKKHN